MHKALIDILPIQEFDMQMIQLMKLKKDRQKELSHLNGIKEDLRQKTMVKEGEIVELKKNIRLIEGEVKEIAEKMKRLEGQQGMVKKVDEFNALSQEISQTDRERVNKELRLSDLYDKATAEDELLKVLQQNLETTTESSKILEEEIREGIARINEEGLAIKKQRDALVAKADPEVFRIYEMLLKNKRDRVAVPIENRCCSGCHIILTAQHENLVRKGERLVYCEHCSRIHYWQGSDALEGTPVATKKRRRTRAAAA